MAYGIIYKITNRITKEHYIGQTTHTFKERYKGNLYKNTHNTHLKNSIKKHGIECFDITEQLDTADTPEELDSKEIFYINKYNSFKKGFNQTLGGRGSSIRVGRIVQLDKKGKYIKTFDSLCDVCMELDRKSVGLIKQVCIGRGHTAYGFKWLYEEDYLEKTDLYYRAITRDLSNSIIAFNIKDKDYSTPHLIFPNRQDAISFIVYENGSSMNTAKHSLYEACKYGVARYGYLWRTGRDFLDVYPEQYNIILDGVVEFEDFREAV